MPRVRHLAAAFPGPPFSVWLLVSLLLAGCGIVPPADDAPGLSAEGTRTELVGVPFHPDTEYYCGPAALATVLGWSGVEIAPEDLVGDLFIPGRRGTLQPELLARTRQAGRLAYVVDGDLATLEREVRAGHPVLVLQNLGLQWWPRWHYAVLVGVEPATDTLTLRSGARPRHQLDSAVFDRTWARGGRWALVVTGPGVLPASADTGATFVALADLERSAGVDAALPYWRAAHQRWPDDGRHALGLANALVAAGQPDAAVSILEQVAPQVNGPLRGVVLNNLATVQADLGDLERAEAHARAAVAEGGTHAGTFRKTLEDIRCRREKC